jgi:uncharacterized protein YceK
MRKFAIVVLLAGAVSSAGCGTMGNVVNDRAVYGGVRFDAWFAKGCIADGYKHVTTRERTAFLPGCNCLLGACAVADMPFSLVGDTVTLPWTVLSVIWPDWDPFVMTAPPKPPLEMNNPAMFPEPVGTCPTSPAPSPPRAPRTDSAGFQ